MNDLSNKKQSRIHRYWNRIKKPSTKYSLVFLVFSGFLAGIIFWGGFNWSLELTNTESFCISCHEMKDNVYQELKKTIHYSNRTGVRATCPDCHVPRPWIYKIMRKIQATNELYHHVMGTVDTKEKFESHRRELAQYVWKVMKETDSRECRNCHHFNSMNSDKQSRRAKESHLLAQEEGKTCIDCHKGIAHKDVWKQIQEEKEAAEGDDDLLGDDL